LSARVLGPDAAIISVDNRVYPEWRNCLYKSFAVRRQKMYLIRGDSHSLFAFDDVRKILEGHKLDFLFIDGDHTYDGVRADVEMYSGLVGKKGLIAFHDICSHAPETRCEVDKFWNEVKDKYEHGEMIKDRKQGWAGIGVIHV
jgi:cephalosporin hydroxylase